MILEYPYPFDIRVRKEIYSLMKAGHKVFLLARNRSDEAEQEVIDDLHVVRYRYNETKYMGGRSFQFVLTFKDRQWILHIKNFITKNDIQVLHVHDLPMVYSAITANKDFNLPIVFDMHEQWSIGMKVWKRYLGFSFIEKIYDFLRVSTIRNYKRYRKIEEKVFKLVDHIIVVIEESKEDLVNRSVPKSKIWIVRNTDNLEFYDDISISSEIQKEFNKNFVVSYIGGFEVHRGLDDFVKTGIYLREKIPNLKLLLIGKGSIEDELKKIVSENQLENIVEFIEWIPFKLIPSYVLVSDVCVVPHVPDEFVNKTIPHKLFFYMLLQRPVIVSDAVPLKRIIEGDRCGLTFRSGNPDEFAEAIMNYYLDKDLRNKMVKNAYDAAVGSYNWEVDAGRLLSLYESIEHDKEQS